MKTFLSIHQDGIIGVLGTFDRMIFKGHLTSFFPTGAFTCFLLAMGVLLDDFGPCVETATQMLKSHAQRLAEEAGRPYEYLASAHTAARGQSKEDLARDIAERDGITEGLICVLAVVELSRSRCAKTIRGSAWRRCAAPANVCISISILSILSLASCMFACKVSFHLSYNSISMDTSGCPANSTSAALVANATTIASPALMT